jgi:DivIVA domain-containing protein
VAVSRDPAFRTVRMRESYDLDAVDDFVDRVIDALEGRAGGRSLTPEKIEAQEFKVVRMREGYSMDDVDDWLDDAAAELRRMRSAAGRRAPAPPPEPAHHEQAYTPPPAPLPAYEQPPAVYEPPPVLPAYEPPRLEPSYEQVSVPSAAYAAPAMVPPAPAVPTAAMPAPSRVSYARAEPEQVYREPIRTAREPDPRPVAQVPTPTTGLHHLEIWVSDLDVATRSFGWLFERLGWTLFQVWDQGRSWQAPREGPYVVMERSPDLAWQAYDRKAPGLNHLALAVPERWMVDRIVSEAPTYGWRLMFADQHPHAGGAQHYAAYLENDEGFEVEVVAP